jgi:hypothetical protein
MNRILKPTKRPLIAFGIVISPVFAIGLLAFVNSGFKLDALPLAVGPVLLYGLFSVAIMGSSLEIFGDEIVQRRFFVFSQRIRFSNITRSEIQFLAERDHPISISVYKSGSQVPALNSSLKLYRKEDVAWLCELPELKVEEFVGFTDQS